MTKMNFNSHKSWHVNSKGNRDKLEKVNQKADEQGSSVAGKKREREKERDFEETMRMTQKYQSMGGEKTLNFMYQPPPGMPKDDKPEGPADHIPDTPENKEAREFLKNAPTKGLWMPLGKEVKVMQCWRCKNYGHRTGDKECPLANALDADRQAREDPMAGYLQDQRDQQSQQDTKKQQKLERLQQLKDMLAKAEKRYMKKKLKKKMKKKEEEKRKKRKDKKHKSKHDSDSDSSDSESDSDSDESSSDSDRDRDRKK